MHDSSPSPSGTTGPDGRFSEIRRRLRAFLQSPKKRYWLRRSGYVLVSALLAPVLFAAGMWFQYELFARPRSLASAGPIVLSRMKPDTSADASLPKSTEPENGAFHYILALNGFNARRAPFLAKRGLNPIAEEPPTNMLDLKYLAMGASRRSCDLYEIQNGQPRFVFYIMPEGKKWAFRPSSDPFEQRPYVGPIRALSQAALNWGKQREVIGQKSDAERVYQVVAKLGSHLRDNPGSLLDIELGIEIEQNSLHYLESLYSGARNTGKLKLVVDYATAVSRLLGTVRAKYARLDNVEVAMEILANDEEPVWRIAAASALVHARYFRRFSWPRSIVIDRELSRSRRDPNTTVAQAVKHLLSLKDADFRASDAPAGPAE